MSNTLAIHLKTEYIYLLSYVKCSCASSKLYSGKDEKHSWTSPHYPPPYLLCEEGQSGIKKLLFVSIDSCWILPKNPTPEITGMDQPPE